MTYLVVTNYPDRASTSETVEAPTLDDAEALVRERHLFTGVAFTNTQSSQITPPRS